MRQSLFVLIYHINNREETHDLFYPRVWFPVPTHVMIGSFRGPAWDLLRGHLRKKHYRFHMNALRARDSFFMHVTPPAAYLCRTRHAFGVWCVTIYTSNLAAIMTTSSRAAKQITSHGIGWFTGSYSSIQWLKIGPPRWGCHQNEGLWFGNRAISVELIIGEDPQSRSVPNERNRTQHMVKSKK